MANAKQPKHLSAAINRDLDQLMDNSMGPVREAEALLLEPLVEDMAAMVRAGSSKAGIREKLKVYRFDERYLLRYADRVAETVFIAAMRGMAIPVRASDERLANAETLKAEYRPLPFDEAESFFKRKKLIREWEDYQGTWAEARVYGFKVAGITSETALRAIHGDVLKAVEGKVTVDEFVKKARERYGLNSRHAELVVRTNVQSAFSWGHWQQLDESRDLYDLWAFDVVVDEATTPEICLPLYGLSYPTDHKIWSSLYPPNHYGCRTTVFPLQRDELDDLGFRESNRWPKNPENGAEYMPQHGFEINVGETGKLGDVLPEPKDPVLAQAIEETRRPDYPGFSDRRKAEKWMMSMDYADRCDYSGVTNMDVVNEFNRSVVDHINRFPELREKMRFLGSCQARNRMILDQFESDIALENPGLDVESVKRRAKIRFSARYGAYATESRVWAESAPKSWGKGSGIAFNANHGKAAGAAKLMQDLQENVVSRFHPQGCATIRSIADHEMGHELDSMFNLVRDKEISGITDDFLAMDLASAERSLSRYAYYPGRRGNKRKETIAEAWAEYQNNPAPRKTASAIGKRIEELRK